MRISDWSSDGCSSDLRNEGDRKRLHGYHEYPLTEWGGIAGSDATLPRAEQTRSLNQPRFMGGSGPGAKFLPASTVVADQKLGLPRISGASITPDQSAAINGTPHPMAAMQSRVN